jgi:hypothetical protein
VQDRDEARYAQASRQMAETGDWVDIRFQDRGAPRETRGRLLDAGRGAGADGPDRHERYWVHRIPSYLAGAFAALALIWAGTPLVGRKAAVLGGVMLATVYMLSAEARTAKTDATLLLTIILAMGAMARAWLGQARMGRAGGVLDGHGGGAAGEGPGDPDAGDDGGGLGLGEGPEPWVAADLRPLPGIGWMLC